MRAKVLFRWGSGSFFVALTCACSSGLAVGSASGGSAGEQGDDGSGGKPKGDGGSRHGDGGTGPRPSTGGAADGGGAGESAGGTGGVGSECQCSKNASCLMEDGLAFCECDDGFEDDGDACVDVDECALDNECSPDAACENTLGSYECKCNPGYVGDGMTCVPRTRLGSACAPDTVGNGYSQDPALSADGRFLGFTSTASNLVADDLNAQADVFVFDVASGECERVSVDSSEIEGEDGGSYYASLSENGNWVAFSSSATNLVPDDTNGETDVFLRDREAGTTVRVSVSSSGEQAIGAEGYSAFPTISNDGQRIAFSSLASNLVSGDTNSYIDVFVRDRANSTTTRVSVTSEGEQVPQLVLSPNISPQIAGGGRHVVFTSLSPVLGGVDDSRADIFWRDLSNGITSHVSYGDLGVANTHHAGNASLSADGRFVVFHSGSSTMISDDTNDTDDIFIRDMSLGGLELVSVGLDGAPANGASSLSFQRSVSNDGRYVVFTSLASNLVADDMNGFTDVFVRDRVRGTTTRVSVGPNGEESDAPSNGATISADGRTIAFESRSTTFGVDPHGNGQIWIRQWRP